MARLGLTLVSVLPFLQVAVYGRKINSGSWGSNRCLGVKSPANDAPTEIVLCDDATAQVDWTFDQPGDNKSIKLSGTNFCLDAGTNPQNNGPAKLYTCFPGLAAQHWYYTGDNRIAITGGDQCLDLDQNTNKPQTYKCTPGNTNQMWTPDPIPTTTTSTPTATPTTVQYIHPHSAPSKCISYDGVYDGAFVYIDTCGSTEYPTEFEIRQGDNKAIYVPGTNLCLTTTDNGTSGSRLSVSYCRTDQSTHFYYTPDQRLAVTGGTTCLDYGDDITPDYAWPLEFLPCKSGDNNQIFTLEDVKATVTTTEAFPDPTTICHVGNQQILKPSTGTNITAKYPSGKVPFQYCSAEYFETSSFNITVYLASATSKDPTKDGVVVGKSSNGGSEYDITLTIPKGTKTAAQSQLFVLEYIGGFVAGPTTTYSEPVSF